MIVGSVIGKRFAEATFESYVVPPGSAEALEACQDLARRGIKGVLLHGPVGLGKTHLFVAVAKIAGERIVKVEYVLDGEPQTDRWSYEVAYWPILELVDGMRREMGYGSCTVVKECCKVDLLLLDDVGEEREMPFIVENLAHIFNSRYNAMLPIGLSTNLSLQNLQAKYGDRAFSRWWETCEVIEMQGKDYRTLKKEKSAG